MSEAEEIAGRLEELNAQLIAAVEACSDDAWATTTEAEGWTAAALAHHVGVGHETIFGLVQAIATGQYAPPPTPENLDAGNATHAEQFAAVSKTEVIETANAGVAKAAAGIRQLSDAQLAQTAELFGNTMSAAQIAEGILVGHPDMHLGSFKAATGQA